MLKLGCMNKNLFITATGTDIGKTYISALIVKKMREEGFNCGYFKPVLSGVEADGEKLIKSDANFVVSTARIPVKPEECVTYWWKEAVSPHLASVRAGDCIDSSKIIKHYKNLEKKFDYILTEGAGGITCPLRLQNGEKYLLKDLIKELKAPVIIVADAGLGTINSVLLTTEYAKNNGIEIRGIILNNFERDNFMHQDNLEQIEYLTGIRVVAEVEKNQKDIELLEELWTGKKRI